MSYELSSTSWGDEEIAALQARYSDDQLFELIVSAAVGASRKRLMAGLKALEEA